MKDNRLKCLCLSFLSALLIDAGSQAAAFDGSRLAAASGSEPFVNHAPLGNDELESMRGGFITSNGMVIDFSFSANTLVDGELINQVVLNTAELAASENLRRIIQVGEDNQAFNGETGLETLPQVLTVVQNNLDNLTIQQLNLLDLTVQNMSNFVSQSVNPEIDFQSTITLMP